MSQQNDNIFRRHDLDSSIKRQNSKTAVNIQSSTTNSKMVKTTHKKRKRIQKTIQEKPKPQTVKDISLSRLFLIPTNKENVSLTDCGFSQRIINLLNRHHYFSLNDLLFCTVSQLEQMRHSGEYAVKAILDNLNVYAVNNGYIQEAINILDSEMDMHKVFMSVYAQLREAKFSSPPLNQIEETHAQNILYRAQLLDDILCLQTLHSPHYSEMIMQCLHDFDQQMPLLKDKSFIISSLKNLPKHMLDKPISPFINAYQKASSILMHEFLCSLPVMTLGDLINYTNQQSDFDKYHISFLKEFVQWLHFDIQEAILTIFSTITDNDMRKIIVCKRAQGYTLSQLSDSYNITDERIRQQETKYIKSLCDVYNKSPYDLIMLIDAMYEGKKLLYYDDIYNIVGEGETQLLWYILKKNGLPNNLFDYSPNYNAIVIDNQYDRSFIVSIVTSMPKIIEKEQVDNLFKHLSQERDVPEELLRAEFVNFYTTTQQVCYQTQITWQPIYSYILYHYYARGYKVGVHDVAHEFRQHILEVFDREEIITDRAIDNRISQIGFIVDRGIYLHTDYVHIDPNVMVWIVKQINAYPKDIISFAELFDTLKAELANTAITNRYILKGVLEQYDCGYKTDRDYIYK